MNYTLETAKIIFYLALVLGLIYLTAAFFRKRINGQTGTRHINLLERSFPAAKTTLALVEVKGRIYLLGIGEQGINVLDRWDRDEFGAMPDEPGKLTADRAPVFKDYLQKFVRGSRDDHDD